MTKRLLIAAAAAWLGALPGLAAPTFLDEPGGGSFRLAGTLHVPAAALARGEVQIVFGYQDAANHYLLRLGGEQAQFVRVAGGKATPIGSPGKLYRAGADDLSFSLHRQDWQMSFIANHVLCARAEDATFADGQVGTAVTQADLSVGELALQPTEPIWLADDFMRTDRQFGGWTALVGEWRNNQQGSKVSRSANAFSFLSTGRTEALAVIGYPFWSDYSAQVAVRSDGTGAVGLAVGVVDKDHYYRLRFSSRRHADGGTARLQRVFGGQVTDLTPPLERGFHEGVWYKVQVALSAGRLLAWIDDAPLFDVAVLGPGEGQVGLWTEPGEGETDKTSGGLFDDVVVRSWPIFSDDFYAATAGRWRTSGGAWKLSAGAEGKATATGDGLLLGGGPWADLSLTADLKLQRGTAGLVVCADDQGHGYALRMSAQTSELVKLGETPERLASAARGLKPGEWSQVTLSRDRGLLRATLDGQPLVEAFDLSLPAGGCGLLADGAACEADNLQARFEPTFYTPPPTVPEEFESDQYMTDWAGPGSAWVAVEGSDARWHKGFFYGDRQVRFRVPGVGRQEGRVAIIMGAQTADDAEAYRLNVELRREAPTLTFRLLHGGTEVATAPIAEPAEEADVLYELRGRFILLWVDGKCVLQHAIVEG